MTPEQLQQMSRDLARLLPEELLPNREGKHAEDADYVGIVCFRDELYEAHAGWRRKQVPVWLHESTEACAEIMVRVLWPNEICINGGLREAWANRNDLDDYRLVYVENDNPMQAFRTVVCLAAIEVLSKEK